MAIGVDDDYVFWTILEKLSPIVADFPAAPYDILIDSNGDQLSQEDWNELPSAEDKIEAIYRTVAVNKARKAFGLPSLKDLRYTKNTETKSVTVNSSNKYVYDGVAQGKMTLTAGKVYNISHPANHPLRFSSTPDGRGLDDEGNPAVEFTKGISVDEGSWTSTTSFKVDNFTTLKEKLYYYCSSHSGMGGEVEIQTPYNEYEPPLDPSDGLPVAEKEQLEGMPIYDNSLFNSLVKDDIVIDLASLPDEINGMSKQSIIDALPYIPTEDAGGVFASALSNLKDKINLGLFFVDVEDALDGYGNRIEYSTNELEEARDDPDDNVHVIQQSDGIGPNVLPYDIDDVDLRTVQSKASEYWWLRVLYEINDMFMLVYPPLRDNNGTGYFDQKDLKHYGTLHAVKELTQKVEPADLSEKIPVNDDYHFDDIHTLLNIKDPAYGVDLNGAGGQDLTKLQKIRKCNMINDSGVVAEFEDAIFSINDVPKGSLYLGSNIILMPPNAHANPHYDDCTRLVLWYYGSNVTSLEHNNNLAYRILHDFNRKWFSDLTSESIDYPDEYYLPGSEDLTIDDVKGLTLTWTDGHDWEEEVPVSLFKLRKRQGGGSGPAFLVNGAESFTSTPSYMETTVKASDFGLGNTPRGDISFTYRVLSSQCKLNTRVFALERTNTFYTLDGYGFDVNPTPANGISVMNQAYFWFPLPSA